MRSRARCSCRIRPPSVAPWRSASTTRDVDAAYRRAVDSGAVPVSPPEQKNWGQKVGYVRDIDGITVRMGSHARE